MDNIITIYLFIIICILICFSNRLQRGQPVNIEYLKPKESHIIHVFWTGGFDSTFRICQLLIDEKRKVQPIYVNVSSIDGFFILGNKVKRESIHYELKTMNKIRQYLNKKYPYTKKLLLKTIKVNSIQKDQEYLNAMKNLYFQKYGICAPFLNQFNGYFSRPYNQYTTIAQYSKNYKYPIEVSVEKCDTGMDKHTQKYRTGKGHQCQLIQNKPGSLQIFDKLRFPIIHLTKQDMYKIAKQNKYDDVLKQTWSCWFPKNGKPCGRCDMCKHRVSF